MLWKCHTICQQIWRSQQWPQDWKRSVFIPKPKKDNAKECSNYRTIALISHASKIILKILQARLQPEKAMATHSSTLPWKIPWIEQPGRLQSMGSLGVGQDWETSLSLSCIGEGNGNPLQYSCLENPRDGGAWWAAICGVTQSWTQLKGLSSSSSSRLQQYLNWELPYIHAEFRKGRGTRDQIQYPLDHRKSKRIPEKHRLFLHWLHYSLSLHGSQQTMENSSRDGNTRPPYLPPEKSVYMSRSNS